MESRDFQAELAVKAIEFELALNNGLPHSDLIKIYKELKELQYLRAINNAQESKTSFNEVRD